ncbi:MAG: sugar phosphate isomerase/epimerase family protein [Huintestinicola sp.]
MDNILSVFYEHIFDAASQRGTAVEEMLLYAKNCGIDMLECDLWRLSDRENTKKLFDSCGIAVSSVYSFFDLGHDDKQLSERKYRSLLETSAYFGADKVLCVPGFYRESDDRGEQCKLIAQRLNEMCMAASEYGITVTLEDFDDVNSPCSHIAGLKYFMENVDGLRFTFDTGNFRYSLEDALLAYDVLKQYIVHIHCKDRSYDRANADPRNTNGKADLSGGVMYPAPVGCGVIGIPGLLRRAAADGYSGRLAIEHFGACDQGEYMRISAENIRNV